MKPFQWTLLAVCAASCRASDAATGPPPDLAGVAVSAPLMISVRKPREPEPQVAPHETDPAKELALEPPPPHSEPSAPIPGKFELLPTSLREKLALAALKAQAGANTAKPEPASSSASPEAAPVAEPAPDDPASLLNDKPALIAALKKAVDEGRMQDVGELAARIAALDPLEKARLLRLDGKNPEAIALLEHELASAPNRPEFLEALAEIELKLADGGRRELYEKARDEFRRAGATPTALLGQSRTELALGDAEHALDHARQALWSLQTDMARRIQLDPAPEVVLADAGLAVHRKVRSEIGPAATELFAEIETALRWRIAHVGTDAVAHARLANLYLEVERFADAERAAMRGLISSPGDLELGRLLAVAAKAGDGGSNRLLAVFGDFRKSFPHQALGYFYPALEYFKGSARHQPLDDFKEKNPDQETQLERAERYFGHAGRQDPRFTRICQQYQALCRALQGWELFTARRYEEARDRFASMNGVLRGSVALDPAAVDPDWAGQIESGATGLARIAAIYRDKGDVVAYAAVHGDLADLVDEDPRWALEAAKSANQAAQALEEESKALLAAGHGELPDTPALKKLRKLAQVPTKEYGKPNELGRFQVFGERRKSESDALFAQTWKRYRRAVLLAPLDVKIACDAAGVAIYHVPSEFAAAEKLLDGAIRLAREQSESPMDTTAKDQLSHVLATALQYQGTIELRLKNNPERAVQLFEEALEIDPGRLPSVREHLLPEARIASSKLKGDERTPPPDHR